MFKILFALQNFFIFSFRLLLSSSFVSFDVDDDDEDDLDPMDTFLGIANALSLNELVFCFLDGLSNFEVLGFKVCVLFFPIMLDDDDDDDDDDEDESRELFVYTGVSSTSIGAV